MERMWRKVSFGGGGSGGGGGSTSNAPMVASNRSNKHSINNINDPTSSAGINVSSSGGVGPFIDTQQYVSAVVASSSATGRRLASSGLIQQPSVSVAVGSAAVAVPVSVSSLITTTLSATSNALPNNPSDTINVGGSSTQQQQQYQQQQFRKSLSQHVLHARSSSAERRRRRRRKSRTRRTGISCVGGGGDNMSSSGGFYTIKESTDIVGNSHHRYHHRSQRNSHLLMMANSAPTGTVMMYPNPNGRRELNSNHLNNLHGTNPVGPTMINAIAPTLVVATTTTTTAPTTTTAATGIGVGMATGAAPDISLRQRAVAKLRMFNFHLNWDLQMTHCKPCGSGSGNIITRRLCRNRRREDNELYRSNSFKFERFERKEYMEELADTLQKQFFLRQRTKKNKRIASN